MPARKYNGITAATYGTTATPTTPINNIVADSKVTWPDQEDNPKDAYDNEYSGLQYAEVSVEALDLTAYAAIAANWKADTRQYFKLTLDNGQTVTTNTPGVLLKSCKQREIAGSAKGRADGFVLTFRIPEVSLTFV